MRAYGDSPNHWPSWLIATLIFVVLVVMLRLASGGNATQTAGLQQQFAANPPAPDAGKIELPPVPTNLAGLARTTTARILGGLTSQPLNKLARNEVLEVEISSMDPVEGGLKLVGRVTNISAAPVSVSLDNFRFTDASGTVYASSGSPATLLQPQQTAPLDLSLPIPATSQLTLDVTQPNQQPIQLILLNTPPTPTP
jgi:hypothetical protein